MKKYLVVDFIVMVILLVMSVIMSFGTVYSILHNQPNDSLHDLIFSVLCSMHAYLCFKNWKDELK